VLDEYGKLFAKSVIFSNKYVKNKVSIVLSIEQKTNFVKISLEYLPAL